MAPEALYALAPPGDLFQHIDGCGAAEAGTGANRVLYPKDIVDALMNAWFDRLHHIEGQFLEGTSLLFSLGDDAPRHMMGIPKWDIQVPDQPIRQIRRRGEAGPGNR